MRPVLAEASYAGCARVRYLNSSCDDDDDTRCVSPLVDVDGWLLIALVDTFVDFHLVRLFSAAAAQAPAQCAASGACHEPVSRVTNIVTLLSHSPQHTAQQITRMARAMMPAMMKGSAVSRMLTLSVARASLQLHPSSPQQMNLAPEPPESLLTRLVM